MIGRIINQTSVRVLRLWSKPSIFTTRRCNLGQSQNCWQEAPSFQSGASLEHLRQFHATTTCMAADLGSGDDLYQKAMEIMEQSKHDEEKREQERSKKMYQAWQKSEEASKNPKSQGVAVVKTLVKETRKAKKEKASTPEDMRDQALELLEQAATEHNHPMALVQLGNLKLQQASKTEDGDAQAVLVNQAADMFRLAGQGGLRAGWYNLGNLYWTGYPVEEEEEEEEHDDEDDTNLPPPPEKVFKPDLHEAMEAFMNAIDLGDTDAMYLVGVHRMTSGGRENIHSGLNMVQKAADEGHGGALYYLALLNLNGEPNIGLEACSLETFVELLDKAVKGGSTDALFTRGHSFFHGSEGYPEDRQRALQDFMAAAESGHADAAVSAGAILHSGLGVPKDQKRAFELYQMAGELGSKEGWQNVVACYTTGEGVAQSTQMAEYITETMLKDV